MAGHKDKAVADEKASVAKSTEEEKTLRMLSPDDVFICEHGEVTGTPQNFPAAVAESIVQSARQNDVRLIVD